MFLFIFRLLSFILNQIFQLEALAKKIKKPENSVRNLDIVADHFSFLLNNIDNRDKVTFTSFKSNTQAMTTISLFPPNYYSNLFELKNFVQKKAQFYGDELKVRPFLKQKESLLSLRKCALQKQMNLIQNISPLMNFFHCSVKPKIQIPLFETY